MRACVLSRFSRVQFFVTLWIVVHQAPLSMGFSRQEYWSGLSCPPPGDHPNSRTEPAFLMSSALAGGFFTTSAPRKPMESPGELRSQDHRFGVRTHSATCLSCELGK